MANTPTTDEAGSFASLDGIDSLSMFQSECADTPVDSQPSAPLAVTVRTLVHDSKHSAVESVSPGAPSRTHATTSGRHSDRKTAETGRSDDAAADAHTALHRLCSTIDVRLVRIEEALHNLCAVTGGTRLDQLYAAIDSRLTRTQDAVDTTVEQTVELGRDIDARFARAEDALRRVHLTVAETIGLRELCVSIDGRLSRAEEALRRTESLVADRTLQQLSARIDVRVAETEHAVHRIERSVDKAQHHLSAKIGGRFAHAEERLQRLESLLESETPSTTSDVLVADNQTLADRVTLPAKADLTGRAQRLARRCAPAIVLFAAMAVVTSFRNDVTETAPPLPGPLKSQRVSPDLVSLPGIVRSPAASVAPVGRVEVSRRAARSVPPAPIVDEPVKTSEFLGNLSITSEPPGATVIINGRSLGVTPLTLTDQRVGSLALLITHQGYARWTAAIQVAAGRLTQVRATLQPTVP